VTCVHWQVQPETIEVMEQQLKLGMCALSRLGKLTSELDGCELLEP
jgi:hypothetical protein